MVFHLHAAALFQRQYPQHHNAVLADVVEGIAQQIVQHPLHHGRIGTDGGGVVGFQTQRPVVLVAQGVVPARHLKAEFTHIKVHQVGLFGAVLYLAQLHHAVDQGRKAVGFIHNDIALFGALFRVGTGQVPHGLGIALD